MFNKKNILVTGGTGSFGYQFVDNIVKNYKPNKLIIFSRDEFKQHEMQAIFPLKKYNPVKLYNFHTKKLSVIYVN